MSFRYKAFQSLVIGALALGAIAPMSQVPVFAAEKAIAPEYSPPGDIPDSQVFINYAGKGYAMKVPEGWSRKDTASGAAFSDKYNLLEISATPAAAAPTVESVKIKDAAAIEANGRAATVKDVAQVKLDGGPAIRIDYQSNSEPNAVTGKQIRLDRVRYLYFKAGNLVTLDMAAPAGADNVDQWLLMANSVSLK
jgi:hypothetical protein